MYIFIFLFFTFSKKKIEKEFLQFYL